MRKLITIVSLVFVFISCNNTIPADDPNTVGMGENAAKVLAAIKQKLTEIKSIHASIESTRDSDMYGFSKGYEGTIVAEFGGKPGTLSNRKYECKQTAKGRTNHLKGVITKDGLKELFLLKKKVVKGDERASAKARITGALFRPYGYEKFFDELEGKKIYEKYPAQPTNTYLEGVETFAGKECYVIVTYNREMTDRKQRYYFGKDDFLFYGEKSNIDGEDGKSEFTTTITKLAINQPLPEFDVEVPEDFAVEIYKAPWDQKGMEVGMQSHDWTLENSKGAKQTLSKEYAKNVVLLDFWATWCGPCKAKMPFIQKMHEKYKDKGLKVISVLSGDVGHEKAAAAYIKKYKYTFDLVFGTNELSDKYKIRFLPTVMMIDATGKIIYFRDTLGINDGIDEKVELEDAIKKALQL